MSKEFSLSNNRILVATLSGTPLPVRDHRVLELPAEDALHTIARQVKLNGADIAPADLLGMRSVERMLDEDVNVVIEVNKTRLLVDDLSRPLAQLIAQAVLEDSGFDEDERSTPTGKVVRIRVLPRIIGG